MDYICAPWRSEYFSSKKKTCPFCDAVKDKELDEEHGVLFRGKFCFGIMNLFPYNPGAFMIIPYSHLESIEELPLEAWQEMSYYVREGVVVLKKVLNAGGVNIGMNLGKYAGAGIPSHAHYHVIPRWERDTNFITTISGVRVNGVPFHPLYVQIKEAFEKIVEKNKQKEKK